MWLKRLLDRLTAPKSLTSNQSASPAAWWKSVFFCRSGWVFRTFFPLCKLPHGSLAWGTFSSITLTDTPLVGPKSRRRASNFWSRQPTPYHRYVLNCYALQVPVVIIKHTAYDISPSWYTRSRVSAKPKNKTLGSAGRTMYMYNNSEI